MPGRQGKRRRGLLFLCALEARDCFAPADQSR